MARYYFHTKDGRRLDDEQGTELADFGAAKDVAIRVLTEALHSNSKLFWQDEAFSVHVTDDNGLALFFVELTAHYSPAIPDRRRS